MKSSMSMRRTTSDMSENRQSHGTLCSQQLFYFLWILFCLQKMTVLSIEIFSTISFKMTLKSAPSVLKSKMV